MTSKEESGLDCDLQPCGILLFTVEGHPHSHYIHIFRAESYQNEPEECVPVLFTPKFPDGFDPNDHSECRTEEMSPKWFAIPPEYLDPGLSRDPALPDIPFDKMWADDEHWFPMLLRGECFKGRADFTGEGKELEWQMKRWWFGKEVQK